MHIAKLLDIAPLQASGGEIIRAALASTSSPWDSTHKVPERLHCKTDDKVMARASPSKGQVAVRLIGAWSAMSRDCSTAPQDNTSIALANRPFASANMRNGPQFAIFHEVSTDTILLSRHSGIVEVTLNRPQKKNAANQQMWKELLQAFNEVSQSAEDRVVILSGAQGAFCSGADLSDSESMPATGREHQLVRMRVLAKVALALHRLPQPTIAKVDGVAAGAGAGLALGCDLVVASDRARFSQIFSKRGLSLDCGSSWLLPRMIGLHRAKELAFFADMITASEAERFGFVNKVVDTKDLDDFVNGWALRLASGPPLALSMTKHMLNDSMGLTMEEALEQEARSQCVNFSTEDTSEALKAFTEKRDPTFTGH